MWTEIPESSSISSGGGDATAAKQDTGNASLTSIDGKLKTGSQTTANSVATNIATDDPFALANRPVSAFAPAVRITGNGSAVQLGNNACVSGVWIQVVEATPAGAILSTTGANVGDSNASATRGAFIPVGGTFWFPATNTNLFYVYAANTCVFEYWWA